MSKIIVFGGSGFIGSHVADELSKAGHDVTIFDRNPSIYLKENQNMILGNINDMDSVNKAIEGNEFVYNFAALSDLNDALEKPIEAIQNNILSNCYILEGCKVNSISRFIYASSVYANSREGGFYGLTKKSAESFVEEYHRLYGLNFTILRYGSLYGPRSNEHNGLRKIISTALSEKELKYFGDEDSVREYIHVKDAAMASVHFLNEKYNNKKIILTGHQPIKIIDLLNMLSEIMNYSKKDIRFVDENYEGHYVRTPYHYDTELALKHVPDSYVDFGEGLIELIRDCEENK